MFNQTNLITELNFKAVRSSGSGGQHVNKVATKIELSFNVSESNVLTQEQKQRIYLKLKHKLTNNGVLILQCADTRSQFKNKELAIRRFLQLIKTALVKPKKRIATKVPKAVVKKRLDNKKKHAFKKANRQKPNLD